ncbi:MAG: hypothetical protein ACI9UN_003529 [Granulosicoccus sp.]|jgi:hypothetical protein
MAGSMQCYLDITSVNAYEVLLCDKIQLLTDSHFDQEC